MGEEEGGTGAEWMEENRLLAFSGRAPRRWQQSSEEARLHMRRGADPPSVVPECNSIIRDSIRPLVSPPDV